jgi:hypothetical protein
MHVDSEALERLSEYSYRYELLQQTFGRGYERLKSKVVEGEDGYGCLKIDAPDGDSFTVSAVGVKLEVRMAPLLLDSGELRGRIQFIETTGLPMNPERVAATISFDRSGTTDGETARGQTPTLNWLADIIATVIESTLKSRASPTTCNR